MVLAFYVVCLLMRFVDDHQSTCTLNVSAVHLDWSRLQPLSPRLTRLVPLVLRYLPGCVVVQTVLALDSVVMNFSLTLHA
jgi:hypothetical protein